MFRQNLLTRERTITVSPTITIAADITIDVTDVVAVFLVELVVGDFVEGLAPEEKAFFEVETDAFEEEGVLEAAEVFEVRVAAERAVEVLHAEREGGGEGVDGSGGDVCAGEGGGGCAVGGVWGCEVV